MLKRITVIALLLLAATYGAWRLSRSRTYQLFGEIVPRVETEQKIVALTFDDGPAPHVREVLDMLKAKGVRATFLLIGVQIAEDPADAHRIVDAGHEIDRIVATVLSRAHPGSIILLHPMYKGRGYQFVTIDELLAARRNR